MAILILFAASLLGGFFFPWWWPAAAAYLVGALLPRRAGSAFLSGFAGAGLAWAALAGFLDWRNHHLLSHRVAGIFHFPAGVFLLAATGLIGGGMGGLAAMAGWSLRAYVKPRPSRSAAAGTGNMEGTGSGMREPEASGDGEPAPAP